jgi:hypothetical protein
MKFAKSKFHLSEAILVVSVLICNAFAADTDPETIEAKQYSEPAFSHTSAEPAVLSKYDIVDLYSGRPVVNFSLSSLSGSSGSTISYSTCTS